MDISRFLASSIMDLRSMARGVAREPKPRSSRGVFLCGRALSRVRDGGRRASCARNTDRTVGGQLSRGAAQNAILVARPVSKNVTGNSTAPKRTLGGFIENIIDQPINFLPKRNGIFISTLISPVVIDQGPVKYRASRHIPREESVSSWPVKKMISEFSKRKTERQSCPREVTTDALSPPDLVSDLGSRVGDGPLDPRQVPRRRPRPRALPRNLPPRSSTSWWEISDGARRRSRWRGRRAARR